MHLEQPKRPGSCRAAHCLILIILALLPLGLTGGGGHAAGADEVPPAAESDSILIWHAGSDVPPVINVMADAFNPSDLGEDGPGLGRFWPFASVADFFAGQDADLRAQFTADFEKYLPQNMGGYHPACPVHDDANLSLYTYRKPDECHQAEFLAWLKAHRELDDFIEPAGRRRNDYRGDLISPVVDGPEAVTEDVLKKTFGHVTWVRGGAVTMMGDNRYNPLRWVAPINEVHHHEQASQAMLFRSAPGQWEHTAQVFEQFTKGARDRRIYLDYDIEIEVEDEREALGEWSIWDYYGAQPLSSPAGLIGQTHWNCFRYSTGETAFGQEMPPAQKRNIQRWMEVRLEEVNIQMAVMVNFLERDGKYRLAEFMLASKDQRPIGFLPLEKGGDGIMYAADPELNRFFVDGGLGGPVGWWRAPISMLSNPVFTGGQSDLLPIVLEGGQYEPIPDGGMRKRFKGRLDLTNFYALARQQQVFPGQRGYAGGKWMGFEGDVPELRNPAERHGIEWLGAIYEVHGPFKVRMTVNRLNATIVGESPAGR